MVLLHRLRRFTCLDATYRVETQRFFQQRFRLGRDTKNHYLAYRASIHNE